MIWNQIYEKVFSMNDELRALNEKVTCAWRDGFFRTGSRQPVQPYTRQLANTFSVELPQRGRTVV